MKVVAARAVAAKSRGGGEGVSGGQGGRQRSAADGYGECVSSEGGGGEAGGCESGGIEGAGSHNHSAAEGALAAAAAAAASVAASVAASASALAVAVCRG
jgi:hypothetical protein